MQPISMAPFPPRKQLFPVSSCERLSQRSVSSGRKNQKQFLSGGKGGFETSCPLFSTIFFNRQKRGASNMVSPKNIYMRREGGSSLAPFSLFVTPAGCIRTPSWRGKRLPPCWRHKEWGASGDGGGAVGRTWSPPSFPHLRGHIRRRRRL
jgi:hypothetical protein